MLSSKQNRFNKVFRLFYFIIPVSMVFFGIYFACNSLYLRNKMAKTYNDVNTINNNIKSFYSNTYKDFNTEAVALNNLLPFDIDTQRNNQIFSVFNRFGGHLFFYEAFYTLKEKLLYFNLYKNPAKYREIYDGTSAYIMLFTGLSARECRQMARHDWKSLIPNYVGIEVSYLDANNRYNGIFKLKTQLLSEPDNYFFESKDMGIISAVPLTRTEAKTACSCRKDNCTIALKFH